MLCRILGVPLSDDAQLIDWGDKMIGNTDPELGGLHPASPESAKYRLYPFRSPAAMEVFRYGHAIAAERREEPRDDLVSKLVTWEDEDGRRLTEREFDTMFLLLVVAGNETTRQSIAHGMLALMEHPEAMSQLRDDPAMMAHGGRRDHALGLARAAFPAHRDLRHGAGRRAHRGGRQGRHLADLRQLRRAPVRRSATRSTSPASRTTI